MAILDSFKINLGFIFDKDNAKKFSKFLDGASKGVKKLSLLTIGLATSASLLFVSLNKQALAQARFGKNIDITRDSLEAFRRVSKNLTGSGDAARELIETMTAMSDQFLVNGELSTEAQRGFRALGLDIRKFINLKPEDIDRDWETTTC